MTTWELYLRTWRTYLYNVALLMKQWDWQVAMGGADCYVELEILRKELNHDIEIQRHLCILQESHNGQRGSIRHGHQEKLS